MAALPYQDLPNHLASIHVLWHPDLYPELVANGFFKTNAALFAWLYFAGKPLGLLAAAKVFALATLFANAFTYPRLVLELTGSLRRAVVASLFFWPMVHDWWVSMGMLDYALGIPLSLWIVIFAERQVRAPSWRSGLGIAFVALSCWYAHGFALLVAGLLVVLELTRTPQWRRWWPVLLPLVPAAALVARSIVLQLTEPHGAMTGYASLRRMLPNWELVYHLWAEWCCGFGWRTLTSFAVVIGGVWGLPEDPHRRAVFLAAGDGRLGDDVLLRPLQFDELVPRELAVHSVPLVRSTAARPRRAAALARTRAGGLRRRVQHRTRCRIQ